MADDINKVMQVGRLTRDAELQYTNAGYALCKFSIAVNQRKKQGEQWIDVAHYFEIDLWGRRGESLHPYLTKGTQVAIEGKLRQQRWNQDGMNRSKVTIEAENVQLLGGNRNGSGNSGGQAQGGRPQGGGSQRPAQQSKGKPQQGKKQGGYNSQNNPQGFESYTPPSAPAGDNYEDDIPF